MYSYFKRFFVLKLFTQWAKSPKKQSVVASVFLTWQIKNIHSTQ